MRNRMLNYQWLKTVGHQLPSMARIPEISRMEHSGDPWFQGWLPCKSFGFPSWFQDGCPAPTLMSSQNVVPKKKVSGTEDGVDFLLTHLRWRKCFPELPSRLLMITHAARLGPMSVRKAISGKGKWDHCIWHWPAMTPSPRLGLSFLSTLP